MSRPTRLLTLGSLVALGVLSCNVFDESLIQEEPTAVDPNAFPVGDTCETAARVDSSNVYRDVAVERVGDDNTFLPACLGADVEARGKDFYFSIPMEADDIWHFHVQAVPGANPAVYVVSDCSDFRNCQDSYWGANACDAGQDEHFTFKADAAGTYRVGVDYTGAQEVPTDGVLKVVAVKRECGNGVLEHPETCDDDLPNCFDCRRRLENGGDDTGSKNDGPLDATILAPNDLAEEFVVTGSFEKACDFDFYELQLPDGTADVTLTATFESSEAACGVANLRLMRLLTDANPFSLGSMEAVVDCPRTKTLALTAGERYLIRVAAKSSGLTPEDQAYTLRLAFEE
jgi:hypothetical protein